MRTEHDALGSYELPKDLPWGIYTARVLDNYPQAWVAPVPELFLRTYIRVKKVYADLNYSHKKIDYKTRTAISKAAQKLLKMESDEFMSYFPLWQIQSWWWTSTHMNVNEVLANLATVELDGKFWDYLVDPHDHINASQSSNDTFPGTMKLMAVQQIQWLVKELHNLLYALMKLAKQFKNIKKVGRTHLQDAVFITLWDEFAAYARSVNKDVRYTKQAEKTLSESALGWTATWSLQNITPKMRKDIVKLINKEFKLDMKSTSNHFEQNSTSADVAYASSHLAHLASTLIKICNDLRLLSSWPLAGLFEITLPEVQAGSSIMPGKINPSILEALTMICAKVIWNDQTIQTLTRMAQLELQQFNPQIAWSLHESYDLMTTWVHMFTTRCIKGIKANKEHLQVLVEHSLAHAASFNEQFGYETVALAVKEAFKTWKNDRRNTHTIFLIYLFYMFPIIFLYGSNNVVFVKQILWYDARVLSLVWNTSYRLLG